MSRIIGHGFLSGRQLISCDREGVVNVWDWKLSQPISQLKLALTRLNSFMMFSNKEGFVVGSEDGVILSYSLVKTHSGFDFVK